MEILSYAAVQANYEQEAPKCRKFKLASKNFWSKKATMDVEN